MSLPKPRACLTIDDLEIGQEFTKEYSISYSDVVKFSEISDDWNPAHHDADYAATTFFKKQIAHGMISVAKFSGIFGMDTPGLGTIWLQQGVTFLAPAYLDQPYTAKATVKELDKETNTAIFLCECFDAEGKKILTGEGAVKPIPAKVKAKMAAAAE